MLFYCSTDKNIQIACEQGWTNISSFPLTCFVSPKEPTVILPLSCGPPAPLQILQQFLSDDLLEQYLVGPLNQILAKAREKHELKEPRHISALTIPEWWCFLARWITQTAIAPAKKQERLVALRKSASSAFGENRYGAVHHRLQFGPQTYFALVDAVRKSFINLLDLGSVITIDDQLISYYGEDMRNAGLAVLVPGKPPGNSCLQCQ